MHIPLSTYRLQFTPRFGFKEASAILDYLAELGVSDIYASPIFKARCGSTHGYDIVNPLELNPELGSPADFHALCQAVKQKGLFWLQDIVPNHMAFDKENTILMDVLRNGVHSPYIGFFDIDWNHYYDSLRGRLLAPFLGNFYAEALLAGEIRLSFEQRGLFIRYYECVFPLKLESYAAIFEKVLEQIDGDGRAHEEGVTQFLGAVELFKSALGVADIYARGKQAQHSYAMIWDLYGQQQLIRQAMDTAVEYFNGTPADAPSFNALDKLISEQLFRLAFWKVAAEEINYRRFFTINELICMKVEDEAVFNYTHDLILRLIRDGLICGLRVDHIDGLRDPAQYLARLREKAGDLFIVVEKILQYGEGFPDTLPVEGTTGYDYMHRSNALFCDTSSEKEFTGIYVKFTGSPMSYEAIISDKKRLIIGKHLAGNIDNLAHQLKSISGADRYGRDITLYGLRRTLVEIMACFPVYRTYISSAGIRAEDSSVVKEAIARARRSAPGLAFELDFIEKFLLLRSFGGLSAEEKKQWEEFVTAFQQYTGAVMAKGFEDTILYVYNRLLSLNEVGGDPIIFGIGIDEFHSFNRTKSERTDRSFNATSTHDVKRGEDARARINVLSEIPGEWERFLESARQLNRMKKKKMEFKTAPDENDEYFIYQTILGVFPFEKKDIPRFMERMEAYVVKAVREAKVHTAWIRPDIDYETACVAFVRALFEHKEENLFLPLFLDFQKKVSFYGVLNSLSQLTLKAACPGIPDFYQGSELWDLSLVDPDNRRDIDFSVRAELLRQIKQRLSADNTDFFKALRENPADGRIKLFLTYRLLNVRKERPLLFQDGRYIPLVVKGDYAENLVAFAREYEGTWSICAAGRFFTRLVKDGGSPLGEEVWKNTEIILPPEAPCSWYDVLSSREHRSTGALGAGRVFSSFSSALLVS